MATTYNGAFEQELRRLIEERIQDKTASLIAGMADFPTYKHMTGFIGGLNLVLEELCGQANDNLTKR